MLLKQKIITLKKVVCIVCFRSWYELKLERASVIILLEPDEGLTNVQMSFYKMIFSFHLHYSNLI
jgi:hypothetical protein